MKKMECQFLSGFANWRARQLGVLIGIICALVGLASAQMATAAPVMPTLPNHLWLLDELGGQYNNANIDSVGGLKHYGARALGSGVNGANASTISPLLIGLNDNLPVLPKIGAGTFTSYPMDNDNPTDNRDNPVPFQYTGNKSAVVDYGDEFNNPRRPNLTPDMVDLANMPNGGLHIGSSGAVSLWINPINHNPNGYQHLFDFVDGSGNRLAATGDSYFPDGFQYFGAKVKTFTNGIENAGFSRSPTGVNDPLGWGTGVNWGGNSTPASLPGGNWSNLIVTWDALGLRAYSNGALLADAPGVVVPDFYATTVQFGARNDRNFPFAAMFDELAIWDSTLTADNALWIFQNSLSNLTPVPEPASAGLLLAGLVGLAAFRRRR